MYHYEVRKRVVVLLQADRKMLLNICNNGILIFADISTLIKLKCSMGRFLIRKFGSILPSEMLTEKCILWACSLAL